MITLFPLTLFLSVVLYAMVVGNVILFMFDIVPFWVCIAVLVSLAIFLMGVNKLSWTLYLRSLDRCDNDPDGFIQQQEKLAMKADKKYNLKTLINLNMIVGILMHERFDEAHKRLPGIGKSIMPNDHMSKFQYISILLSVEMKKKNFNSVDYYISEMRSILSQMNLNTPGYNANVKEKYNYIINGYMQRAEFFSRSPEMLSGKDRYIAENMVKYVDGMMSFSSGIKVFKNYYRLANMYDKAVAYTILGEKEKADELFNEVTASSYLYPFIDRARRYKEKGDVNVLMG